MIDIIQTTTHTGITDNVLKINNDSNEDMAYSFGNILENDDDYTFSCWMKSDNNTHTDIYISDNVKEFALTPEWKRVVFTSKFSSSSNKTVKFSVVAGGQIYAYEGQLEHGNKATDFRSNEKDITDSIQTVDEKLVVLQTDFSVEQGKIEALIRETTIDNDDGTKSSLKDKYLETVATVDGMKTTIGDIQTTQSSISSKVTEIEATTEGIKTNVSNVKNTADSAKTTAEQTANKFNWLVKSGTSSTDFTLTDRTAQLVADSINLHGLVTFKGLNSSTQNKINNKVNLNQVQNYVTSRGENLITNGTALYGDNTNFDGLTYDGSDTYYAGGSFKYIGTSTSGGMATTREFIPVDVASKYELSYYIKVSNTNAKFYDFVSCYDIDKNEIMANHVMWVSGSTTTLAKELKNGDTVVYLNSTKGFNSEVEYGYQKGFIFWNYKSSKGYSYGTETYSRNVYESLWDDGASINKSNNTITLKSAWNHGTVASGTPVSQCSDGNTYIYLNSNFTVSSANTWVHKKGIISGVGKNNKNRKFREGTAFVKVGWRLNYNNVSSSTCWLSTISFTQNGNVKANQSIIDNWAKDSVVNGETVINGGYIKTNTIKTDQLAVDDIFATGSAAMNIINAQEINANRITSGQLSAERINVYGLSVLNKDNNQQTFNITNNGEVTIKGSVSSSNYNIGQTGWSINNDGTAEFNDIIARGSVITNDGGIANSGSIRFWAGTSYEERESAPWIVYSDGSMKATQGEFSGVFSGTVDIGNIRIIDPSSASGGDALLTIQDGGSGLKRVQLTDSNSSIFAQDLIISNNTYSPMVTLKQDGTALFDRGINIGDSKDNSDNVILNKTSLIISNKELTTTSTGFLINSNLDVGSSNDIAHLTVHGDTISDSMTLSNELNFSGVVKFTTTSNGINIDFVE